VSELVVLEIRGVGGATAEEILDGRVVQTAGDEAAGFYRRREPRGERTVEAYEWGRLTSGSRASALWWILFPFTLVNVAGWMFRPTSEERSRAHEPRRSSLWWGRLLIVLGGLAITATFVMWLVALTTEMVAFGCGTDPDCRARWYVAPLTWFAPANEVWLVTCGIGLAGLAMLGLFVFIQRTQASLEGYESEARRVLSVAESAASDRLNRNTQLDDHTFWYKWSEHRRLVRWHLGLTMALLGAASGHALTVVGWTAPQANAWLAIAAVVTLLLFMTWRIARPEGVDEPDGLDAPVHRGAAKPLAWTAFHLFLALLGGGVGWLVTGNVSDPGFGFLDAVRLLTGALYVAAFAMVVVLLVRRARRDDEASLAIALMPGFSAALAVVVAGAGFAAVANLLGRFLLGGEWVASRGFDIVIVDIFAISAIAAVAGTAFTVWRSHPPVSDVTSQYFEGRELSELAGRERSWVRSVARARVIAATPARAENILALLTLILLVLTFIQLAAGDFVIAAGADGAFAAPLFKVDGLDFFHTVASTATVLYLFPGIQLIRATTRSRASRRQIGKVWDVLSFWPRRFHPLAAPCYAERAVPEFRDRIKDHLTAGRRVIVSAHSQGTVIAFAALVQLAADDREIAVDMGTMGESTKYSVYETAMQAKRGRHGSEESVSLAAAGLVTFGSPLSSLYGRFFPWHFGAPGRFAGLRSRLATLEGGGKAWRSLWRPTDYIGQRVFIEPGGVLDPEEPDPDIFVPEAALPLFPVESHSNYEWEPLLQETIDLFADSIPPIPSRRGEQ
jgi:hypothetical protein